MGRLDGKVALVSGGARGVDRASCVRLAEAGADVVTFDVLEPLTTLAYPLATAADLDATVAAVKATGRDVLAEQADVRDPARMDEIIDRTLERFGRLDVVVANAGIMPSVPGHGAELAQAWHDALDVMLTGAFHTIQPAIPAIRAGGRGGSIVIVSSIAGLKGVTGPTPGAMGYTAAKHGVVGLMRAWANTLAPDSIRVNTVHPSAVRTPMTTNEVFQDWARGVGAAAASAAMANPLPVDMLEPEDVANAICWLCTDEARYVTGVPFPVDAGRLNR